MEKSIETTGITRDAAIEAALQQLSLDRDSVSVEVLDNGTKGFLGMGAKPARVRVTYEAPDELEKILKGEPIAEIIEKPVAAPERRPHFERSDRRDRTRDEDKPDRITARDPRRQEPRLVRSSPTKSENVEIAPAETVVRPARPERPTRPERIERPERTERVEARPEHEEKPIIPVSPEAMEKATTEAIRFIEGLLKEMGIEGEVKVQEQKLADQLRLEIAGPDMGPVIGRRGDTLDAIQYLTSLVMARATEEHVRLSIDAENYREKRAESLERLAEKMAGKVVRYHKAMTLEPMNPYERRIIHSALQNYRGVTTYSTGSEPGRRVVIAPEGGNRSRNNRTR